jgi:peptidoglycan/xylan/chitin deacetylase (PgdA/CDA1 family)
VRAEALLRKGTKAAVFPLALLTRRRPGDVVILLYHRVGDGAAEIELPLTELDRQLAHLSTHEPVISIDDALEHRNGGGVVVSFDDGTRDFAERALPLLVKHRVPAVLYLATGLVADEGGTGLCWSQVREAAATGFVTIGSHTHSHADLSRSDERTSAEEMCRSKDLIEERLGTACRHFAYPWAVGSTAADRAARRLFDSAALHAWRTNRAGRTDPYRLGRTPVLASDGFTFFHAKARGMLDGESFVYRALRRGPWGSPS